MIKGFVTWEEGKRFNIPNILAPEKTAGDITEALNIMGFKHEQIKFLVDYSRVSAVDMADAITDIGLGTSEKVTKAESITSGLPYFPAAAADYVKANLLHSYAPEIRAEESSIPYVPVGIDENGKVLIAISNPAKKQETINSLHKRTRKIEFCLAAKKIIQNIYRSEFFDTRSLFTKAREKTHSEERFKEMLQALLIHACYQGASDLHFLPLPNGAGAVFIRIDGVLEPFVILHRNNRGAEGEELEYDRIIQVIKMDTASQDGVITEGTLGDSVPPAIAGKYQFRVEITMTVRGASAVIRILSVSDDTTEFEEIGFDDITKKRLLHYAGQSAGMLIVTGPTGSGKTTTLNALMKTIDPLSESVQSIENPVELQVGLWAQHHAKILDNSKSEAQTWIRWFKALMRRDPDTILYGEIRDADTTAVALDGANTGHNVFTTMHTKSASSAVQRLRNMKLDSTGESLDMDAVSSTLHGILAQRLLRKLCNFCKIPDDRAESHHQIEKTIELESGQVIYRHNPDGCEICHGKGYRGRHMIYELLHFTREVRQMVSSKAPITELEAAIDPHLTLWGTGMFLVSRGVTSIDELRRVALEDIE